jgi:hypothetical protein
MTAMDFAKTEYGDILRWVQPVAGNRYHELRSRSGIHAKLKWKGMYGSLAYVHTSEGTFTLKRAGFLNPRVTVRMRPGDSDVAVFDVNIGITGTIAFDDGPKFEVRRPKTLRRQWSIVDWDDRSIITVKNTGSGRFSSEVAIRTDPRKIRHSLLMSAIVWYAFIVSIEEWEGSQEGPKYSGI